jgi:hypothetical protein
LLRLLTAGYGTSRQISSREFTVGIGWKADIGRQVVSAKPVAIDPEAVLVGIEIPQRSSLPPYTDVLSFRSEAPTAPTSIPDLLACREVIR